MRISDWSSVVCSADLVRASPERCSFNMGSMNFGLYPMIDKYKSFQQSWESQYLEASRDWIFRNTFKDIEYILETLGKGHGTRFEFECYDVGHLYALAHFLDRKLVTPPLFVQSIFGILGGRSEERRVGKGCVSMFISRWCR